jgi:NAD-dependent dihydropyrimidine dehydrogenase PreA subunit
MAYKITEKCELCGSCKVECPQAAIESGTPYKINQESCIDCGACEAICPARAIITTND